MNSACDERRMQQEQEYQQQLRVGAMLVGEVA